MNVYILTWAKEVRVDCTVYIEAHTKEGALLKWRNGEYSSKNYDESEGVILDEDAIPKITEQKNE